MHGSRARIGVIVVSDDVTTEMEYARMAPEGVGVYAARMRVIDELPPLERLARMVPFAREAARDLATLRPGVVAYACTSGSFFRGAAWSRDYMAELSAICHAPVIATAEASVDALKALGVRRIGVATPYTGEVNELLAAYLAAAGFGVEALCGAGLTSNWDVAAMSEATIAGLARGARTAAAEAIFIACTAIPVVGQIERLEADLGLPVITANQATFWAALRASGIAEPLGGFGTLLAGTAPLRQSAQGLTATP